MAEATAEVSSVDHYGMPRLIYNYLPPDNSPLRRKNDDHGFCLKSAQELEDDLGQVLLKSRVQRTWKIWNQAKALAFPNGMTDTPQMKDDRFSLLSLALAKHRDWWALDLRSPGDPQLVELTEAEHAFMGEESQLFFERHWDTRGRLTQDATRQSMANFLIGYIGEQDLSELQPLANSYWYTNSHGKRKRIGRSIFENAIDITVDPLRPLFDKVAGEGMIDASMADPAAVIRNMLPSGQWPSLHRTLVKQVAA